MYAPLGRIRIPALVESRDRGTQEQITMTTETYKTKTGAVRFRPVMTESEYGHSRAQENAGFLPGLRGGSRWVRTGRPRLRVRGVRRAAGVRA